MSRRTRQFTRGHAEDTASAPESTPATGSDLPTGWRELLAYAKQHGVNTFRKSRADIEAELRAQA